MEIVYTPIKNIYLDLLETNEVISKFDDHHLKVDGKTLGKLFKMAALNRKRDDLCDNLTLYEFGKFSKSEEAARDFKAMMDNIKTNTLTKDQEKLLKTDDRIDEKKIIPVRSPQYTSFLPSSFNPLMTHFMDEEARSAIRTKIVQNLKKLEGSQEADVKNRKLIEENTENMKKLFKSHFQDKGLDEDYRKLKSQNLRKQNLLNKDSRKIADIVAEKRRAVACLNRQTTSLQGLIFLSSHENKNDVENLALIREKKKKEIMELVKTARKGKRNPYYIFIDGHKEACRFIKFTPVKPKITRGKSVRSLERLENYRTYYGDPRPVILSCKKKRIIWAKNYCSKARALNDNRDSISKHITNDTSKLLGFII